MHSALIVGKPNAGKTLFLLQFAQFLGLRALTVRRFLPEGGLPGSPEGARVEPLSLSPQEARRQLVDAQPHKTRELQALVVKIPERKGSRSLVLVDSGGLSEGIHPDPEVRLSQAETIRQLLETRLILHLFDAARVANQADPDALSDVDRQIAAFGGGKNGYAILANKMDLPAAKAGLREIRRQFPGQTILPVSALTGQGFREVRAFVRRHL